MMKSIKFKILIPVIIIILLGVSGKSLYDYAMFQKEIKANIDMTINAKINKIVQLVNNKLEMWKKDMNLLAANEAVKNLDWDRVNEYITRNKDMFSDYEMLFLANSAGDSNNNGGTIANIADREYFKEAMKGQIVISDPLVSKGTGNLIVVVAAPVKNDTGNIIGVIGGNVPISELTGIINEEKLGDSGYAYMVNQEGLIIAHEDQSLVLKENYLNSNNAELANILKEMVAGKKGTGEYTFNGVKKISAFASVTATGWSIAMTGADKELFAALYSYRNNAIINTIIIIILIIAALYLIVGGITKSIKKLTIISNKLALGNTDVIIDIKSQDEVGKLAESFKKMVENTKEQATISKEIAEGNLDIFIKEKSEDDILSKSLNSVVSILKELVSGIKQLTGAAVEGRLATRGNVQKYSGGYRTIVEGINATLDAVIGPLNVAADYVDKISKGNIPPKISDSYNGDFNEIKNNLNTCIDAVNALVADANMLSAAAVEGRLKTRADASKHKGDFRKIVEGVNTTLDAVIEPINEALISLQEMEKQNLTVTMNGDYKGDHDKIKEALNNSLNSFNEVLSEINNSADMVAMGSKQVSDSSQALSQGSTEQASSVEEITASITQAAAQVKQNAANAAQANELAENAKEYAVSGNSQMSYMLNAMEEINESSGNISKIIKVIDDIAFQTNILALNAAVEAARAGQHGKGFAVVAEEVRNLAAKSANAAKETTGLIEGSIKKAEAGTKIATETAESLSKIAEEIGKASNLVAEIASASNEQAAGIAQINQAINQVAQVTQMNTATAEESASASEELSSQAEALKSMIEKFKLKKLNNSSKGMISNNQDMMKLIEEALKKRMGDGNSYKVAEAVEEAAAGIEPKVKISLDDKEFGKY